MSSPTLKAVAYRTPGPVDRNTIHRILRKRTYTGCVVYKGEHDAIIDVETFEKVQTIIDSKRNGQGPRRQCHFENILQGVLYGACNEKMTSANGRSRSRTVYRHYRCYGQIKGPPTECKHPRVLASEVGQVIDTALIAPGKPWQNGVSGSFNGKFATNASVLSGSAPAPKPASSSRRFDADTTRSGRTRASTTRLPLRFGGQTRTLYPRACVSANRWSEELRQVRALDLPH